LLTDGGASGQDSEFIITFHDSKFEKIKIDLYRESPGFLSKTTQHLARGYARLSDMPNWHYGNYEQTIQLFNKEDGVSKLASINVVFSFSPIYLPDEDKTTVDEMNQVVNALNRQGFDDDEEDQNEQSEPTEPSSNSESSSIISDQSSSYQRFLKAETMRDIESLNRRPQSQQSKGWLGMTRKTSMSSITSESSRKRDYFHILEVSDLLSSTVKNDSKLTSSEFAKALSLLYKFENGLPIERTGVLYKDLRALKLAERYMAHSLAVYGSLVHGFCTNSLSLRGGLNIFI
jgi:hypothetical protein